MKNEHPLVIGVGNEFRGDDGIGLFVARTIEKLSPPEIEVVEASGEGTQLMKHWENHSTVYLVDALYSGANIGEIHRLTPRDVLKFQKWFKCSSHQFGIPQAISMAQEMGTLPEHVVVFGIESRNFEFNTTVSEEVKNTAQLVVHLILKELVKIPLS